MGTSSIWQLLHSILPISLLIKKRVERSYKHADVECVYVSVQELDSACSPVPKPACAAERSSAHMRSCSSRESVPVMHSLTLSRGASYMSTPPVDTMSCSGRCLCSCHCATTSVSAADVCQVSPPSSPNKLHGFLGTLKKKFSQMMKRDLPASDQHSDSTRRSRRTRSSDGACASRSASQSRTLPRNMPGAAVSGASTPSGLVDCTFDTFEHRRSRSLRRHRTKAHETTSPVSLAGGPLSPSHFRRIVTTVNGLREEKTPRKKDSIKHRSDSTEKSTEDPQAVTADTGYGHTSAPVVVDVEGANDELLFLPSGPALPFYDQVKDSSPANTGWCLTRELFKLPKYGWYWGPITRAEAEDRLAGQPDGAFLLRDSSDDRYLLSLSFRSDGRTLHTRIEHCNGLFSFYAQPESEGYSSVVDLIERSMSDSQSGVFCYSRARTPGSPSFPVRLARPVSRFTQVRSLQYLCRFVIRQHTRVDYIQKLPLPTSIKGYLEETQYWNYYWSLSVSPFSSPAFPCIYCWGSSALKLD